MWEIINSFSAGMINFETACSLLEKLLKGEIEKMIYPEDMDEFCIPLCDFFNSIGLKTQFSCDGHDVNEFYIIFSDEVTDDLIESFIKEYSKEDHSPFGGYFFKWIRKGENQILINWVYMYLYGKRHRNPIIQSRIDFDEMKKIYENRNLKIN